MFYNTSTQLPRLDVVKDALTAHIVGVQDGVHYAVVDCRNYIDYMRLPSVVSYNGRMMGKTGWNSDKNVAYYQSTANVLHAVRR
jgi:hypothetical protein